MSIKIGVYVCECGPNIAEKVDIDAILETIPSLEEFKDINLVVKRYKLLCSNEGKQYLEDEINANELTHLVVAACSPRDHESTFMEVCKKTSLNPYLFKMVNIREHCAWIISDKAQATEKAIRYIRAGIRRTLHQSELLEKELDSSPDVLVIGGGIAGITAALTLASDKRKVTLVEKNDVLGGKSIRYSQLLPRQEKGKETIQEQIQAVLENENIQVFTNSEVTRVVGFFGNFEVVIKNGQDDDSETELKAGAIVVATGFKLSNPDRFSDIKYTKKDEVYTSAEIESMISEKGKITLKSGEIPKKVALVHCVGRDEKNYCSKICCSTLLKTACYLQAQSPDITIQSFYRDLCLPYKEDQHFYEEVEKQGVRFIRVKKTTLQSNRVEYTDIHGSKGIFTADMVILAPAMEPSEGADNLANLLGIQVDETGFFQEAHYHLEPVSTTTEGIYIVGAGKSPAGISESVEQAQAAAGKILVKLIPGGKLVPEVKVTKILEDFCTGCQTCLDVCCYGAIYFDDIKGVSVVNEAVCRGCGNCAASCPSGAIMAKHFTAPQLYQEMIEAVR